MYLGKPGNIGLQRTNGSYLIVEIAHLLAQVGIVPRVTTEGKPVLSINELADLQKFETTIGFTDPEQQARLRQLTERTVSRATYGQEEYVRARAVWEANPSATIKQLAAAAGVSGCAIRSWRDRGLVPKEVTRLRILEKVLDGHERNIDLLAELFRDFNLSVVQCQHVAARYSRERVLQIRTYVQNAHLEPRENPDLFFNLVTKSPVRSDSLEGVVNGVAIPEAKSSKYTACNLPQEHQDDPLLQVRDGVKRGAYRGLRFFEALQDLAGRAQNLSYPCWTFEKFVGSLNGEDRLLARRLLVVLTNSATAQSYQAFLVEQSLEQR